MGKRFHLRDFAQCIKFGNAMPATIRIAGGSVTGTPARGKN
jgi:hypothetical protein